MVPHSPFLSDLRVILNVRRLGVVTVTVAPSIGLPAESETLPFKRAWAPAVRTAARPKTASAMTARLTFLIFPSIRPAQESRRRVSPGFYGIGSSLDRNGPVRTGIPN